MTDYGAPNAVAQLRANLDRLAGLGQTSRGRDTMDTLIQDDDDINIRITDINQGAISTNVYQDAEDIIQRLDTTSVFRIITIYSESTIEPLRATPDLMEQIMSRNEVHPAFLHIVASFGDGPHLSESSSSSMSVQVAQGEECTVMYQIRYPEENHRMGTSSPWSLRHTGVYHRHSSGQDLYIVLQPRADNQWENQLFRHTNAEYLRQLQQTPFLYHDLLFSCYFENWRWYLRYLGDRYSKVNDLALVVRLDMADAVSSFNKVQSLRNLYDFALFSGACCRANQEVVEELLKLPQQASSSYLRTEATRMRGYAESADILQSRIRSCIELVRYTLTLHNELETAKIDSELRDVTKELKMLTQDTVDDSITVKIITFVSAFYIPGSFVGTLFGMNFFVFDSTKRRIVIAHDFWIFLATWLPLTLLTAGLYLLIVWLDAHWNQKEVRWPWKIKRRRPPQHQIGSGDMKSAMSTP